MLKIFNESFDILKDPNIERKIKEETAKLIYKEYFNRYGEFLIKMDELTKKYYGPINGINTQKKTFAILMAGVLQDDINIIENSIKAIIDLINFNETFMPKYKENNL